MDCDSVHGLHPVLQTLMMSIFSYWLQGKTSFVSQSVWTWNIQGDLQKITHSQDLDLSPGSSPNWPWPLSLQVTPYTRLCVNSREGYWWFDIDSCSNVTLENVFLIEDSVNDIEFSSRSRFYTDVHMASDNCLPFLRSLHPYVGRNQVLSRSIGIYYWDPPMLQYALSPNSL